MSTSGPNVTNPSSDSQAISGQSQQAVHDDGIDYIKKQTFGSSTSDTTSAGLGSVPPSNPGVEDTTGGIASSHGGVSKTAGIESPVPNTTSSTNETTPAQDQTIIGSIKSVLGFGTTSTDTTTGSSLPSTEEVSSNTSHYGSVATAGAAGLGASAAAGVASMSGSTYAADTAKSLDQTKLSYEDSTGVKTGTGFNSTSPLDQSQTTGAYTSTAPYDSGNAQPTSTTAGPDNSATTVSGSNPIGYNPSSSDTTTTTNTTGYNPSGSDTTNSNPTTSAHTDPSTTKDKSHTIPEDPNTNASRKELNDVETVKPSDKGTTDTTDADQAGAGPGDKGETTKKPHAVGGQTGNIENPSAIPTAGGQRLGKAHWGESDIVPDNPKPAAGVEGDNKGVVKENTAKNTGSATGGPGATGSHGEEKFSDKVMDKMHIGHHKA